MSSPLEDLHVPQLPELRLIQQTRGDGEGLVLAIVECGLTSQGPRFVYVVFETNRDVPDAAENKITLWDVNLDDDEDRVAYHHAVHDLIVSHIFPLLEFEIPRGTLLRSGGIATYTLRTVDGSLRLVPGMVGSMKETETRWLQRLPLVDTTTDLAPAVVYDIDDVIVVGLLDEGSRGAMLATLPNHPGSRFVALWIPTFTTFAWPDDDDAKGILHEMTFLRTVPPHPHVIRPPVGYISRVRDGKKVLCGYLVEHYPGGSLGEPERAAAQPATRIKWAYQIASGLRHLHHVARTYHGDIKLANVVLDANGDAVLVDLEQGRANEGNAAPELHAACLVSVGGDGRLHYRNPQLGTDGAGAKEHADDDDDDDDEDEGEALPRLAARDRPYDIWKDIPRAIEAAEAWSFATALGPLLSDVDAAAAILAQCRKEDPNCRRTFEELEECFLMINLCRSLPQQG